MSKIGLQIKNLINKIHFKDHNTLQGKLISGIFWNLISVFASQGFPFIATILIARILGKFEYGQLGMINSTVLLFSTFAGLGLAITATKYIAQLYQTDQERTGRIIGLINIFGLISGILMGLILFILSPWISSSVLNSPDLTLELQIVSLLLIFNTLVGIQSGTITGFGEFKNLAKVGVIQGLISFITLLVGVYFFGLIGVVTALVINSLINLVIYKRTVDIILNNFKVKIQYLNSKKELNIIWKFALPTMMANIVVGPVIWLANTIIVNIPNGYSQLGIFTAVDQWKNLLLVLPVVMGGVLLPMVSANVNNKNYSLEAVNVLSGWIIVIIIALPLISFPEILGFIYGADYSTRVFFQSLAIMMLVTCIMAYKDGIARKLYAKNLVWWGFLSNIIWAITFIVSVIFLKNLGSLGLAVSFLISYAFVSILFIPFYLSRDVVPQILLVSKEIFFIWIALVVQTYNAVVNNSLMVRTLIFIVSIIVMFISFNSIWKRKLNI